MIVSEISFLKEKKRPTQTRLLRSGSGSTHRQSSKTEANITQRKPRSETNPASTTNSTLQDSTATQYNFWQHQNTFVLLLLGPILPVKIGAFYYIICCNSVMSTSTSLLNHNISIIYLHINWQLQKQDRMGMEESVLKLKLPLTKSFNLEMAVCSHGLFICLRIAGTLFLDPFLGLSIFLLEHFQQ